MIHPTAIVDSKAEVDVNVTIGPYSVIANHVSIGSGTVIGPHVIVDPYVSIGPDCHIFQYASVGAEPQAIKFKGEKTYVKIGRGTVVREFATINRGTEFGSGVTEIGEENLLMAYCHVAHDCQTGRKVILANNATLAGHISIGDYVMSGGELGAAVLSDAIIRLIPGVLNDETSALTDTFQDNLLAPPVYTRPRTYKGMEVPDILLGGNFPEIEKWREEQALQRTRDRRPDLLEK